MATDDLSSKDFTGAMPYIKLLAKQKHLTVKAVCETLGLNYNTVTSQMKRQIKKETVKQIITYLDGDWDKIGHILYIKDRYRYLHKLGY